MQSARRQIDGSTNLAARKNAFDGLLAGLRIALGTGDFESNLSVVEEVKDWTVVAGLARRHRVLSLMMRGLNRADMGESEAVEALRLMYKTSSIRGLSQLAGLRAVIECLDNHTIPSLVLKGIPLSERLYNAPLERENYDIDLLVPPQTATTAADALCLNGWEIYTPSYKPTPMRNRYFERYVKNRIFIGPGGVLEMHHRLTNNPFLLPICFEDLSARAIQIEINGSFFSTLNDEDLLIYLCVHGQMHRWSRLKWLCDVTALLGSMKEEDFIQAVGHAQRLGLVAEPLFAPALGLCSEVLHADLSEFAASLSASGSRTERQKRQAWDLWWRPGGGKGLQGIARRLDEMCTGLVIRPSWHGTVHELARLFASPYDLGRVNLPDQLFFLYLPLRPLLWLMSRMKRIKTNISE